MQIDFTRSPNFDVVWPVGHPSPITLRCKRLSYQDKRSVEDGMISVSNDAFARGSKAVQLQYAIGTIKSRKIWLSVYDWEGVTLDAEGKDPVKFTNDKLLEVLSQNGGVSVEEYGHFETFLLARIDEENNFADTTQPKIESPKN